MYNVKEFGGGLDELRERFPDGLADSLNWIVASTSGTHGTYATLDDIERGESDTLTVLIIMPRIVGMLYGNVQVESQDDIDFLRRLINSSMAKIFETQVGNLVMV